MSIWHQQICSYHMQWSGPRSEAWHATQISHTSPSLSLSPGKLRHAACIPLYTSSLTVPSLIQACLAQPAYKPPYKISTQTYHKYLSTNKRHSHEPPPFYPRHPPRPLRPPLPLLHLPHNGPNHTRRVHPSGRLPRLQIPYLELVRCFSSIKARCISTCGKTISCYEGGTVSSAPG